MDMLVKIKSTLYKMLLKDSKCKCNLTCPPRLSHHIRWEEVICLIRQISPVPLFEAVGIHEFEQFFLEVIPANDELSDSEWVK